MPFTADEGAYLFDAKLISIGKLPGGDVLTKSPVVALAFAAGVTMSNSSLFAARAVNIIADLMIIIPLTYTVAHLTNKKISFIAGVIWLISAGPISFNTLGHTQSIAILLQVTTLALLIKSLVSSQSNSNLIARYAFFTGVSLALSFAARKTSIAVAVPMFIIWITSSLSVRQKKEVLFFAIAGTATVFTIWLAVIYRLYGHIGLQNAIGLSYFDLIAKQFISIVSLPGEDNLLKSIKTISFILSSTLLAVLLGLFHFIYLLRKKNFGQQTAGYIIALSWLASLFTLYTLWPTFIIAYLADFLLPATIVTAIVVSTIISQATMKAYLLVLALLAINLTNLWLATNNPISGLYTRQAIIQAANFLQSEVSKTESIFTAAVIIPYMSGHQVAFNIAHPMWYRPGIVSPSVRQTFLPSADFIIQTFKNNQINWAITDSLTNYAYQTHYPTDNFFSLPSWRPAKQIESHTLSRMNQIIIYQRQTPENNLE